MFVNDFQCTAVVALENLRGAPEERAAQDAAAVLLRLVGMKSVGVRSNRYVGACNLDIDGIDFGAGRCIRTGELAHAAPGHQRPRFAVPGFAGENDGGWRIHILELLLRFTGENSPELLHFGAYFVGREIGGHGGRISESPRLERSGSGANENR